ncbi:hypothetical protein BA894_08130 [Vibrio natriegens]|nr:hypothetical protein VEJY3_07685 [Vibrio sp. EJY3]ANQ26417.1 hypothetical protein BA894_08130 [Vibrio natriegens]AXT70935.1 hypothetical protein DBX26_07750 [Vibrio sp. dhg]
MFVNSATGIQDGASEHSTNKRAQIENKTSLLKLSLADLSDVQLKFEQKLFVSTKQGDDHAPFLVAWFLIVN